MAESVAYFGGKRFPLQNSVLYKVCVFYKIVNNFLKKVIFAKNQLSASLAPQASICRHSTYPIQSWEGVLLTVTWVPSLPKIIDWN